MKKASTMHSLRRTSPKGGKFIGTCALCGKADLGMSDMNAECDNQRGVSADQAVIDAIVDEQ